MAPKLKSSSTHRLLATLQDVRKAVAAQELFEAQSFEDMRRREEEAARDASQQAFESWLASLQAERIDTDQLDNFARGLTAAEIELRTATQFVSRAALRTEACQTRYAERSVEADHAHTVLKSVRKRMAINRQEAMAAAHEDRVSFGWMQS